MDLRDKKLWLGKHSRYLKLVFNETTQESGRWVSHGGLIFSTVELDPVEYLYSAIKETLFTRCDMMKNGSYQAANYPLTTVI